MTLKAHISVITLAVTMGLSAPAFAAGDDADGDGVPDSAEALLGTDPQNADTDGDLMNDLADPDPTFMENPINADGAPATFTIGEALVENNFDYTTNKAATDHLELQIINPAAAPLKDFSLYIKITDAMSGKIEGAFMKLPGFEVPANGDARIHFDDGVVAGHFRANPNSIYITSEAAKTFDIQVKSDGFAPLKTIIEKDKGGAEKAD